MIQPREYQSEALRKVLSAWKDGVTRQLISLPVGAGKTIVFGLVAEALRTRTLILAHREELLHQAEQKIHFVYPDADTGILKAEERNGLDREICIASIQTAARHTEALAERGYNLLICDEAHHAASKSYMKVFDELGFMAGNPEKLLLGVTATAFRGDKLELADAFDKIVFERSIETMMRAGYLCDIRGLSVNTGTDISCVHLQTGDFAVNELSAKIDIPERNELIAETYINRGENRHGVVFCVKVQHALNVAEVFRNKGVTCEAVYGDMPTEERQGILERYARHEVQMLTNVGVLTEGWDVPDTDIIMMARPTKSKGLYIQCVGRGLRIAPNKKDCLLVDFVDIAKKHELCGCGTLARKPLKEKWNGESFLEELEENEREPEEYSSGVFMPPEEEEFSVFNRSAYVWQNRDGNYQLALMNDISLWCRCVEGGYSPVKIAAGKMEELSDTVLPLDYCMGVCEDSARSLGANYALKNAAWRLNPATDKQKNLLHSLGISFESDISKGEAQKLIGQALNVGATEKQIWFIKHYKLHSSPELLSKREATQIIKNFKGS